VVRDAGRAYYNLHSRGMASFQCDVVPDWHLALGDMPKTNPDAAKKVLLLLEQLHFTMGVAADDTVKVTHTGLEGETNQQVLDGLSQIYGGMEQMVTGMFQTWSFFMLRPPFPDAGSDYELVDQGPRYLLKYKDDASDVTTTFGHDFALVSMKVTNPALDSTVEPILTRTPQGFVIAGYSGTYTAPNVEEPLKLDVRLEYSKVQGLEMLSHMAVNGMSGKTPFSAALGFANCKATMK
jgi:hypothetical protein